MGSTAGSSAVFEQTAESYISRLLFSLEEEDQLVRLESDAAGELRRGSVVVTEGQITELDYKALDQLEREGWPSHVMVAVHKIAEAGRNAGILRAGAFAVVAQFDVANLRISVKEGDVASIFEELNDEEVELLGLVRRVFQDLAGQALAIVRPIALY
jgi:hypothetical protein